VALLVAIPLGTLIAIYLSEFAAFGVREVAKPFLELLGGVPTIIYGYFALVFLTPLLQQIYPDLPGFNLLSAGIVMGIMIIPYVSVAGRRCHACRADGAARRLLCHGGDAFADLFARGHASSDFRHCLGLHPGDFTCRG
jgi:hypothetical protein